MKKIFLFSKRFLSTQQYQRYSETTLQNLLEQCEDMLQDFPQKVKDVEYSSGVLSLTLEQRSDNTKNTNTLVYVINKQPPNQQIWLSSPISGPKRYDFDEKTGIWTYRKDGSTLDSLLSMEMTKLLNTNISIRLPILKEECLESK